MAGTRTAPRVGLKHGLGKASCKNVPTRDGRAVALKFPHRRHGIFNGEPTGRRPERPLDSQSPGWREPCLVDEACSHSWRSLLVQSPAPLSLREEVPDAIGIGSTTRG